MANSHVKHATVHSSEKKTAASPHHKSGSTKTASFAATRHGASVEQRAYEIYMRRISAGAPGDQVGDWLQAESELRSETR